VGCKGGPVMKPKYLALLCAIFFVTAIAITGCSTKGLNYEGGIRYFEDGNYVEAMKIFQEISKTDNKYKNRALFYIGECYKFQFKWDDATANFHKVVDADPTTYL